MTEIDFDDTCQEIEAQVRAVFADWSPGADATAEEVEAHVTARVSISAVIFLRHLAMFKRPDIPLLTAAEGVLAAMLETNPEFEAELAEFMDETSPSATENTNE